jgi:hypothetical protein
MEACSFPIPMTAISYSKKSTTVASLPLRGSEAPGQSRDNTRPASAAIDSPDSVGASGQSHPSKHGVRAAPEHGAGAAETRSFYPGSLWA